MTDGSIRRSTDRHIFNIISTITFAQSNESTQILLTEQRLAIYLNLIFITMEVTSLAFSTHGRLLW